MTIKITVVTILVLAGGVEYGTWPESGALEAAEFACSLTRAGFEDVTLQRHEEVETFERPYFGQDAIETTCEAVPS